MAYLEGCSMRISGITYAVRKTHKTRNIVLTVIILLFLVIISLVLITGYESWVLLHPEKEPIGTFSSNIVPEYRDISIPGSDESLKGWLFQAGNSDRAVILVHSYGKNRLQFGIDTVDLIKELLNKGYGVLAFDLRNSGESGGKDSAFGYSEKNDVKAAINYMKKQGWVHITLLGFSTGADAALLAAADGSSVDAVIADSPYADLKSYLNSSVNQWTHLPPLLLNQVITYGIEVTSNIDMKKASPVNLITAENPPHLLLIHGKDDKIIPVVNSIELYQKYSALNPSGAEFWQTGDDGHATSFIKYKDEYLNRVFAFLDKVYTAE